MPPWKPAPKPTPARAVPAKKPSEDAARREQHGSDAADERGGSDQHDARRRQRPEHVGGQGGDSGEDAEAESAVDDRFGADEVVDQGRAE
jgi:hypothetical protein